MNEKNNMRSIGMPNGNQPDVKIDLETIFTKENVIDILTADDIYNGYRAIAQLTKLKTADPLTKKEYNRGAIVQINNLAIALPTAIVGNAKVRNVIVVLWEKRNGIPQIGNDLPSM